MVPTYNDNNNGNNKSRKYKFKPDIYQDIRKRKFIGNDSDSDIEILPSKPNAKACRKRKF